MRYSNFKAFEKHLTASAPHHLCRIYFIAAADDGERKAAVDAILAYVLPPDALLNCIENPSVQNVLDALNTLPLLGGEPVVFVPDADKKLLDALAPFLAKPLSFGRLLIASRSKAGAQAVEKQGVILDLTEEKPWEKEKRLQEMLHEKAAAAGKRLTPDAAQLILEKGERDFTLLSSEMDKLLCYTAERATIERSDVETMCASSRHFTMWQIAEELVWEKRWRADEIAAQDTSFFHGLLAALRQQLQIGAKMQTLIQSGMPPSEWHAYFPKLYPKALEKKAQVARQCSASFFRRGLDHLFQMELIAKSGSVPTEALLDLFRLKLISE